MPLVGGCKTVLGGERMEKVNKFKYLETVLLMHEVKGEISKKVVKGKGVIGTFATVMERDVFMKVKRGLSNSIFLPFFMYGSDFDIGHSSKECLA